MTVVKQVSNPNDAAFPAPIYRETVLEQVFADAKRYFFEPLLEIEYAHILMLGRQQIVPSEEVAICIRALDALDLTALRNAPYHGSFEDLFFLIEHTLASTCGAQIAGKMHTARSRNDIDLTMYRMVLRNLMTRVLDGLIDLRVILVNLAWQHRAALAPAYIHSQPA